MKPKTELYSPEMEQALVAAALMDGGIYDVAGVQSEHFQNVVCAKVWRAIGELRRAGEFVDPVTVLEVLEAEKAGVTLADMAGFLSSEANVTHWETYARSVLEYDHRREVKSLAEQIAKVAYSSNGSYADDLAAMQARLAAAVGRLNDKPKDAPKTSWTVAELYDADFPEPQWAVPDIVPVGLSFLAGRPKVGKSWLALQIAHAVSTGGKTFDRDVTAGRVLYLALEDGPRRLKKRLRKHVVPREANIQFETTWRRFTDGGLNDLQAVAGDYSLIVIDTISRALGRVDQGDLADMTLIMGDLQQLALDRDIAIIVIDHHRKPAGPGAVSDPIDDILGSTGKSAVADAALGLSKQQGKAGAVLKVTGRDIEEQELALSWDAVTCAWQLEGTVEEVELRGNKTKVLDALRDSFPGVMTLSELSASTGIGTNNLHPLLNDLVNKGLLERLPKVGREVPYCMREGA